LQPNRTLQYAAADELVALLPRKRLRGTKGAAEAVEASKTAARIEFADSFIIKNSALEGY
jgi:hypothetical protein